MNLYKLQLVPAGRTSCNLYRRVVQVATCTKSQLVHNIYIYKWKFKVKFRCPIACCKVCLHKAVPAARALPFLNSKWNWWSAVSLFECLCLKAKIWHGYRGKIYAFYLWSFRSWALPHSRTGPKCVKKPQISPLSGLHWPIIWWTRFKFELDVRILHIYPHTKCHHSKWNTF